MIESLRSGDLKAVRAALNKDPAAAKNRRVVVTAGGMAWREALELLVGSGADLNGTYRGYRPLHSLLQEAPPDKQRLACLRWMLTHGANPALPGAWPPSSALLTAAFTGHRAYVDAIRQSGFAVDRFAAAALGEVDRVGQELASDPAFARTVTHGNMTALLCCVASRMDNTSELRETARLLLDAGADLQARAKGWSQDLGVANLAVSSGHQDMFRCLLERGLDATVALSPAAWRKSPEWAEIALAHGAEIDRAVDNGRPLLNELIRWGQVRQALWLLAKGADPNLPDERGWTALHQAASRSNERMLRAVLDAGGDRERRDSDGATPYEVAASMRRTKLVGLLRKNDKTK